MPPWLSRGGPTLRRNSQSTHAASFSEATAWAVSRRLRMRVPMSARSESSSLMRGTSEPPGMSWARPAGPSRAGLPTKSWRTVPRGTSCRGPPTSPHRACCRSRDMASATPSRVTSLAGARPGDRPVGTPYRPGGGRPDTPLGNFAWVMAELHAAFTRFSRGLHLNGPIIHAR